MDLTPLFESFPEIRLAYQFGSTIRHPERSAGDIDIALLLGEGVSSERRFEIQTEVADQLKKLLKKEIDVCILNTASPFLAYQVLKNSQRLYGDPKMARDFTVNTLTRYFDYLPLHDFFVKRLEKRLGVPPHG